VYTTDLSGKIFICLGALFREEMVVCVLANRMSYWNICNGIRYFGIYSVWTRWGLLSLYNCELPNPRIMSFFRLVCWIRQNGSVPRTVFM